MTGIDFAVVENQFSLKSVNLKDIYCSWLIKLHFKDIFCSGLNEVVMLIEFLWTTYVIHVHACNTCSIFISVRRIKKIYQMLWMKSKKVERENARMKHINFYPFFRTKDVVTYVLEGKDLLVPFLSPTTFLKILKFTSFQGK